MKIKDIAKEVFEIESKEIANLSNLLTDDFEKAVKAVLNTNGKFIISGMGKSGIIGKKIAATLASTGTPSFFLHPGEAYHGDLGMIEKEDIVLLISNSGETDEVLKLIPFLREQANITISMSGNTSSTLATNTNYHLNVAVEDEACPLQLAPMSSTTATLVMGDAIAVALMKVRNFKDENFAKFHPGGSLGRRLLTTVDTVMKTNNLPMSNINDNTLEVLHNITSYGFGLTVVCENKKIIGLITDGDLRKAIELNKDNFFALSARELLVKSPIVVNRSLKLTDAQYMMENKKINSLLVINEDIELIGIVTYKDIVI